MISRGWRGGPAAGCILGLLLFTGCGTHEDPTPARDYPVRPVSFTEVRIADDFWLPRIETNRTVTIPFAMRKNEETGRVNNFALAAGRMEGRYQGRRFNDTDVYKVLEGVAYSLQVHPDPDLEKEADRLIELIGAAQEEDGYLYPARTAHPEDPAPGAGPERWSRLGGSHELYNSGHMFEAAVAYFQATGKTNFLDIARKNADLLVRTFGPDKRRDTPGHQEIEIGLAKLFRVTGKLDYLNLAKFFLDERGGTHAGGSYPEDSPFAIYNLRDYKQDHLPVLEQREAVGHAVRATYMYTGMADVAALLGDLRYIEAIDRLWENVVGRKLYLTGGVGARYTSEAFGDDYELPNLGAYTETCAAIGNVFWNFRMFLLHEDARYIDVMERVMYNGLLSGVSLRGDSFFYQNPLESKGGYERSPWFEVSCCPGNVVRFLPSFPGYVYARKEDCLFVNLYVDSEAEVDISGTKVLISQETRYPWEGRISLKIKPQRTSFFTLALRIPVWAMGGPVPSDLYAYKEQTAEEAILKINGRRMPVSLDKGYARIQRNWNAGDRIELQLPMTVRRVVSHDNIVGNRGRVALERGPLVYCLEEADNGPGVRECVLPVGTAMEAEYLPELLGGVVVLKGIGLDGNGNRKMMTAIPYYGWAHRGAGEMAVWIKR